MHKRMLDLRKYNEFKFNVFENISFKSCFYCLTKIQEDIIILKAYLLGKNKQNDILKSKTKLFSPC